MTNRRRSGKGRTSTSKKADSAEKPSRKLTRRGKRTKKSESPEKPQDSDYSGDEQSEERDSKEVDRDEGNEGVIDSGSHFETNKSNEDQKSILKEEESGGSDGSWKVKSENGGGGGIPKLKLCLTRPPEMSSPTSTSDQNPSPRRRRRTARGNITPTKEEDQVEEVSVEETTKRVTRNQKAKEALEQEISVEEKKAPESEMELPQNSQSDVEPDSQLTVEPESQSYPPPNPQAESLLSCQTNVLHEDVKPVCNSTNSRFNPEEDETRMAVESISVVEPCEDSENGGSVNEVQSEVITAEETHTQEELASEVMETIEADESMVTDTSKEISEPVEKEENNTEYISAQKDAVISEGNESELKQNAEEEIDTESNTPLEVAEKRRSLSRDSSEERAKEAALRSRNKNKKKEGSEEGEVVESPKADLKPRLLEHKKSSSPITTTNTSDTKENIEDPVPAKLSARKRRWGSSTNKTCKKPSVSISTDFLKEIIPEVKPLLPSEVQLSPNEDDEEGQLKDSEENLPISTKKIEREKIVQSDESEKDYEEEAAESGMEDSANVEAVKPAPPIKEKEYVTFTRKVSVLSSNEIVQKSPSPPRNKTSNILYIVNLVRPFTIPQLRELLARTGTITEDGFWIDKIKSKCYVKYESEEEAKTTRHALHGVRWPISNPKQLNVDFGTEAAMKAAIEGHENSTKRPIPSLFDKQIDIKSNEKGRERDKGDKRDRIDKEKKDRAKQRDSEKREDDEKEKKSRPPVEPLVRDRTVRRVTMPVREWDLGKNEDGFSPPPDGMEFSRHRDDRYERRVEYDRDKRDDYDDRRRREKERSRRSTSNEPPRKSKKKSEEEAPAKLLDDLFRKTKATPCIYWLPLTPEQISVKEEMRRKHMAEHEKKVAELRKIQREQSKRNSEKRRRRTKSRSRSRSPKK